MRRKLKSSRFKIYRFKFITIESLIYVLLVTLLVAACSGKETAHEHKDVYTCPMHPTVISDLPGVCPVCAMELVRKGRPGEEVKITGELARLIKSTNEIVLSDVKTIRATYKAMPLSSQLYGVITYDTRNIQVLSSRISGRLEKVNIKYNYQPVRRGQQVAEIYSPELVNAQREYIFLLTQDASNSSMIDLARKKLLLLGLDQNQLEELGRKKEVKSTFPIFSSFEGIAISKSVLASEVPIVSSTSLQDGAMGMNGAVSSSSNTVSSSTSGSADFPREGNYVTQGQMLFRLVNTSRLWVEFNAPSTTAAFLKKGAKINWMNGEERIESTIDFIQPFFKEGENFIKIRSYVTNKNLSIGQLVEATVQTVSKESLWVPESVLLSMGNEQVVFIKQRGSLVPKVVTTGARAVDHVEVTSGITSGDEIALHAAYLIDSENFIKTSH